MKFDPHYFVKIANRAGVELKLNSEGRVHFSSSGYDADVLFLMAAKKHKKKLLRYLKEEQEKRNQFDLFDNPPPMI